MTTRFTTIAIITFLCMHFTSFSKDNLLKAYLKNGEIKTGVAETAKESNYLLFGEFNLDAKKYTVADVDSFYVNEGLYVTLSYHNSLHFARVLLKAK